MESGRILQINGMMNDNRCNLCPRGCNVDRIKHKGFCQMGSSVTVARSALHFMEEPCISGTNGSGTIFFTGCNLRCLYCQNYKLSHQNFGVEITEKRLGEIMLELQEAGAHNINLVTAVPYVPEIIKALDDVRHRLTIPVVYNTSGYETVETIQRLKGYVDIYLTDMKYYSDELAEQYSKAPDYFAVTTKAVQEMIKQTGAPVFYDERNFDDAQAILKSGVIIRHMVLPGARQDSMQILRYLAGHYKKEEYILSLLSQYTPHYRCDEVKQLNRRITTFEYDSVVKEALRLGLDQSYMQERSSAKEEYTPDFSLQGVYG